MRKLIKKALIAVMAASMLISTAPVVSQAATVTRGSYDFSKMTVRRVWFNTNDPVFMIDNYQRVWLDKNSNVLATGNYKTITSAGDLMAPMKEMFAQIGVSYTESGNDITIVLNGDTLKLTIGSQDVEYNGTVLTGALSASQTPKQVNVKATYPTYNTYLSDDYNVTYLPVAYILNKFGADIYVDSNVQSFYAAIPVMKTEVTPSYETVAEEYGSRYDDLTAGTLASNSAVADNIVALQNADGGFQSLPVNTDMAQSGLADKLGTLRSTSTLLNGATTAELAYLAKYITETQPENGKYQDAFVKGIKYLTDNQNACGAWQMSPTAASGFQADVEIGNKVTVQVLSLLSDIALLNNQNYVFARKVLDVNTLQIAVTKGNDFLVTSQVANNGVKAGWATQYKTDGTVTMGRTYERESVSAFATKAVVDYLITVRNPSDAVQQAVNSAVTWLQSVKIAGKEQTVVKDESMNNGYDVYLTDGSGTWASNYVYDSATNAYRPLYSDVDPTRPDQKYVNTYDLSNASRSGTTADSTDLILYATRTTIPYYNNSLADSLIATDYPTWQGYLRNGFPALPKDPTPAPNNGGNENGNGGTTNPTDNSNTGSSNADNTVDVADGSTLVNGKQPGTGDRMNIWIYVAIAAGTLCIGGAIVVFELKRRKKLQ